MPFCCNCGNNLKETAKFCDKCGTPVVVNAAAEKVIKTSNVKKCPACGELLSAYTIICPSCGNEVNEEDFSNVFSTFSHQVNVLEKAILGSNSGFVKTLSAGKKILWIAFNIIFVCFPLLIRLIIKLISVNIPPKLTYEEKQLATFVENYSFPNNREMILEALIFTKEKIDFISKEKVSRKTTYWMRIWYSKAEQLKDKANILFPNDAIVEKSFQEILKDKNKVEQAAKINIICGIILVIFVIFYLFVVNS